MNRPPRSNQRHRRTNTAPIGADISLEAHFGRCDRKLRRSSETKSVRSDDSSFSFSETVLGQLLAKNGLKAAHDFEVEHKGSKKHLYATLVGSSSCSASMRNTNCPTLGKASNVPASPTSSFRRPTRATRALPAYPTKEQVKRRRDSLVNFDGDDLYLEFSASLSFQNRVVYVSDEP